MKIKFLIPSFILILIVPLYSIAQNNELKYPLLEAAHGKPLGKINAITHDPHRYMWFAGHENKCHYRFDRIRMISFRHDETNPNSIDIGFPEATGQTTSQAGDKQDREPGEISLKSKDQEGTEFCIVLPE